MYNSTIWTSLLFSAQIFQLARTINLNFPIFTVLCPANIRGRMKCFGGYFQMKLAVRKLDKANQISLGYSRHYHQYLHTGRGHRGPIVLCT